MEALLELIPPVAGFTDFNICDTCGGYDRVLQPTDDGWVCRRCVWVTHKEGIEWDHVKGLRPRLRIW